MNLTRCASSSPEPQDDWRSWNWNINKKNAIGIKFLNQQELESNLGIMMVNFQLKDRKTRRRNISQRTVHDQAEQLKREKEDWRGVESLSRNSY